jgi:hypothetical protein
LGRFGKSTLIKVLVTRRRAMVISISSASDEKKAAADILYDVAARVGQGQPVSTVVLDLPRSAFEGFPWYVLELLQSGTFMATKYQTISVNIDHPHILVFANRPAPIDFEHQLLISPARVIQIELRDFHNWVEEDLIRDGNGPQTFDQLRNFAHYHGAPGVTIYDGHGGALSPTSKNPRERINLGGLIRSLFSGSGDESMPVSSFLEEVQRRYGDRLSERDVLTRLGGLTGDSLIAFADGYIIPTFGAVGASSDTEPEFGQAATLPPLDSLSLTPFADAGGKQAPRQGGGLDLYDANTDLYDEVREPGNSKASSFVRSNY